MTIFHFSIMLANAVFAPAWGDWSKTHQPSYGAWDSALLASDGEKRFRTFMTTPAPEEAMQRKLARAGFVSQKLPDRCVVWARSARVDPLTGGVSPSAKFCPNARPQWRFDRLPPF
jgi:hypothetical protein